MSEIQHLPSAIPSEKEILGLCLYGGVGIINTVLEKLEENDFVGETNQRVLYRIIKNLSDSSVSIDLASVTQKAHELGYSEISIFLAELYGHTKNRSVNIQWHIAQIKAAARVRRIMEVFDEFVKNINQNKPFEEISSKIEADMSFLSTQMGQGSTKTMKDVCGTLKDQIILAKANSGALTGLSTGIPYVDTMTGGLKNGELIVIGARPSVGKSVLGAQIALAQGKDPVGVVTLEMSSEELGFRMLASQSGVSYKRTREGRVDDFEFDRVMAAVDYVSSNNNIFFEDASSMTISQVRAKFRVLKMKHNIKLGVVDYLQLLSGSEKKNRVMEIGEISRGLKSLAKELQIPIVALAQLNRTTDEDVAPKLSHLRESGCISGDSIIYGKNRNSRIKDLSIDADCKKVYSLDMDKSCETLPAKAWKTGIKTIYKMTLSTGHTIKATSNHKFLINPDIWMPLGDIKINDLVAIPLNCPLNKKPTITKSEARLLGLFVSNGCALSRRSIQITLNQKDEDLADQSFADCHDVFPGKIRPHKINEVYRNKDHAIVCFYPSIKVPSKKERSPLSEWLRKHGLWDKRAKNKSVPQEIYSQPEEIICEFLKSIFSGDGTCGHYISKNGKQKFGIASYSSSSRELVDGIQWLLQCIGIVSGISEIKCRGFVSYILQVYSRSSKLKFAHKVGFLSKRKQLTMEKTLFKMMDSKQGFEKYIPKGDIVFVPVKKIEEIGDEEVWDMEVPGTHNFIANGIVTHNSIEQDADMVLLLHRLKQTEMDIKNGEFKTVIFIAKQRNGPPGDSVLILQGAISKFIPVN